MKVSVIVAAAGTGSRMGNKEKKQFISLEGIPILIRTLRVFDAIEQVDEIVVVTGKEDIKTVEALLNTYQIKTLSHVVAGGERRQDSVQNALAVVTGDVVMIHDGARPFVTAEIIKKHLEGIVKHQALITCVPVKDTIKVVKGGIVQETLDRASLVQVQTPQTFYTEQLRQGYAKHQGDVTDDASVMEEAGYHIATVAGSYKNIKITTPEDLAIGLMMIRGEA